MTESEQNTTFVQYLVRLIAWDGVLPVVLWLVPIAIQKLVPNPGIWIAVTAVFLPIFAFFIRYLVGISYINQNHCGKVMRKLQTVAFCLAILGLIAVDSLMIILQEVAPMAKGGWDPRMLELLLVVYLAYLSVMAFALYPGFPQSAELERINEFGERVRINRYGGEEYV